MSSLTPLPGSPRRGREGGKVQAGTTVTQREGAAEGGGQCPRWYVRPAHSRRAQGSTPHASHHTQTVSDVSKFPPAVPVVHSGFLLGLLREIIVHNGTCAAETGMPLRGHNVAFVERFVKRCSDASSQPDMPDIFYWHGEASKVCPILLEP